MRLTPPSLHGCRSPDLSRLWNPCHARGARSSGNLTRPPSMSSHHLVEERVRSSRRPRTGMRAPAPVSQTALHHRASPVGSPEPMATVWRPARRQRPASTSEDTSCRERPAARSWDRWATPACRAANRCAHPCPELPAPPTSRGCQARDLSRLRHLRPHTGAERARVGGIREWAEGARCFGRGATPLAQSSFGPVHGRAGASTGAAETPTRPPHLKETL